MLIVFTIYIFYFQQTVFLIFTLGQKVETIYHSFSRKFAKMKPKFPSLATPENIDDDDDDEDGEASEDDSGVHEEDERLESHGDSVEEKEVRGFC